MTRYPYELSELSRGVYRLNFVDFPMLKLFGRSHYILRLEAAWALNAFLSIRIRKGLDIPKPVEAIDTIAVEEHIDFRLNLHWSMQTHGKSRRELADELELSPTMVANILEGEENGERSPYLEAIASRNLLSESCEAPSSICGARSKTEGAELALLAV